MIVFIAWNAAEDKPGEMPRICPACHVASVIGHGWRRRQARDADHTWIRIHRGICKLCGGTLTLLPNWLIPRGHYSLTARQQAAQLAGQADRSIEACVPDSQDPDRSADPSTVRRWLVRRWLMLRDLCWGQESLGSPTTFAWDGEASRRTLIQELNTG